MEESTSVPRFYHHGQGELDVSTTPQELADLPLDALRSQLYPVFRDVPQQLADRQGQPVPIGLPQRMMFNRWKSGGMKVVSFAENAKGYVSARDFGDQHSGVLVAAAGIPPVRLSAASFATSNGATALVMTTNDPHMNQVPISRGYVPPDRYVSGADLDKLLADSDLEKIMALQTKNAVASEAMQEATAVRSAIFDRMGPSALPLPWYARR